MNAKEMAEELIDRYQSTSFDSIFVDWNGEFELKTYNITSYSAKICALIAVEYLLYEFKDQQYIDLERVEYWKDVREQIKKA
jgi:hypothetical protein